jgi:hypothetical protein
MELTCSRCHEIVQDGYRYCPACGLPQLVYSTENSADAGERDRWNEAVRDANTVDWRSAIRSILPLAIPAGILCSLFSQVSVFGVLLMAAAAAWAVALYTRSLKPAWITIGAGARIGLVTGVVGGWTAAAATGLSLFAMRFWLHKGSWFDDQWQDFVNRLQAQGTPTGADAQNLAAIKAAVISPEGRAGFALFGIAFVMVTMVLFAIAGGALGARRLARPRRSGN